MKFIKFRPGLSVALEPHEGIADQVHVFEEEEIGAINASLAAGRPLLVRGEPGTGKSQLARAAAEIMGRTFIPYVVDNQTESRDLLWSFDSVRRLAEAQLAGALRDRPVEAVRADLVVENFVLPGPLWWAFDWTSAKDQAKKSGAQIPKQPARARSGTGCLVLIDEIDKAEAEVPNGLLEALGSGRIAPPGASEVIVRAPAPLIVITTNEERALPDAFIRRCLVLKLKLPEEEHAFVDLLMRRGKAHFPDTDDDVRREAAKMIFADRIDQGDGGARSGQAEYLDMLRVVVRQFGGDPGSQIKALRGISQYVLKKHDA